MLSQERNLPEPSSILAAINSDRGCYDQHRLSEAEYQRIYEMIRNSWRRRLLEQYPSLEVRLSTLEMADYHTLCDEIDHKSLWGKSHRLLSKEEVDEIKAMPFFQVLREQLGDFDIADEEKLYPEEMYWRLARPGEQGDVGPLHADSWYWSLGHGEKTDEQVRVKLWMSICTDKGLNGFRYIPGSHRTPELFSYEQEFRDGLLKPRIDIDESQFEVAPFASDPGQMILFHDDLVHGGLVGGEHSRVSLEWTCLLNE